VMHMLWESNEWLERYVKNAGPREETAAEESEEPGPVSESR
jgi:hypothetical protein